jgi:hypothetical protein
MHDFILFFAGCWTGALVTLFAVAVLSMGARADLEIEAKARGCAAPCWEVDRHGKRLTSAAELV